MRNLVDAAVSPPGLEAVTGLVAPPSSQIGGPGQSVLAAGSTADRNCVGAQRSQQADLTAGSADTPTANLDQSLIRVARPPSADHHAVSKEACTHQLSLTPFTDPSPVEQAVHKSSQPTNRCQ